MKLNFILQSAGNQNFACNRNRTYFLMKKLGNAASVSIKSLSFDKSFTFTSNELTIPTDSPYSSQGTHDYSTSTVLTVFGGLLFIIAFVIASLLFRCRCCYRNHERQTTLASNSAALRRHQQPNITSQSPNLIDQHIWHLYQIPPLEPPPAYDAAIMLPICTVPKYVPNENSDVSQLHSNCWTCLADRMSVLINTNSTQLAAFTIFRKSSSCFEYSEPYAKTVGNSCMDTDTWTSKENEHVIIQISLQNYVYHSMYNTEVYSFVAFEADEHNSTTTRTITDYATTYSPEISDFSMRQFEIIFGVFLFLLGVMAVMSAIIKYFKKRARRREADIAMRSRHQQLNHMQQIEESDQGFVGNISPIQAQSFQLPLMMMPPNAEPPPAYDVAIMLPTYTVPKYTEQE